jgi:hypothetical protein
MVADPRWRALAAPLDGVWRFDFGEQGSLCLCLHHDDIQLRESAPAVDCTFRLTPALLYAILAGEQNLLTAFLRGEVRAEGSLDLAERLHWLLRAYLRQPSPSAEARP